LQSLDNQGAKTSLSIVTSHDPKHSSESSVSKASSHDPKPSSKSSLSTVSSHDPKQSSKSSVSKASSHDPKHSSKSSLSTVSSHDPKYSSHCSSTVSTNNCTYVQVHDSTSSASSFDLTRFLFRENQVAAAAEKAKKKSVTDAQKKECVPNKSESRVSRISRLLDDPYTKLNCIFLQSAITLFDSVNTVLQKDEPCIHVLHCILLNLLQNCLVRFVKPQNITSAADLTQVSYKSAEDHKVSE